MKTGTENRPKFKKIYLKSDMWPKLGIRINLYFLSIFKIYRSQKQDKTTQKYRPFIQFIPQ